MAIHRRVVGLLAGLSIAASGFLAATPAAAAGANARFTEYQYQDPFDASAFAAGVDAPVTAVLQLSGDPVAKVKAKAPGKTLNPGQQESIERDLDARQESLRPSIEGAGATVIAKYQDAYNGIKVQAPASTVSRLAALPGVAAVRRVAEHRFDNSVSVPYIGAPSAWSGENGVTGTGVRVGIIDTGIDYTHSNFGGPGTVDAFNQAKAAKQRNELPDPGWFGPGAPKVKGGVDLVGDGYNAGSPDPAKRIPHPGVNPLDCAGHGSHVAGTSAGFGVNTDGSTYRGPYDGTTHSRTFKIGPGVAPGAELYAIRVFGCEGSTNVVVEALDWAVAHHMDVVNMSLGSTYGSPGDPDIEASNNAADAGIVVVASAGNSGSAPYINGSPSLAQKAISVAAVDSSATFPGIKVALSNDGSFNALNANGAATLPTGPLAVKVLRTSTGQVSLGCNASDYAGSAGKLVVTQRGNCARVDRAIFGQRAGAAAVAMINTSPTLPPFEGAIPGVTIPFLGVSQTNGPALVAADGKTATLAAVAISNPAFTKVADFSSSGPTRETSALKPDVAAPGVSILSTAVGTGSGAERMSGTSMAAPHVSGVAALARQAHPDWPVSALRAAIINTADPGRVGDFQSMRAGTGLVQPARAAATQVVAAIGDADRDPDGGDGGGAAAINFGFREFKRDFEGARGFRVTNFGGPVSFKVSVVKGTGAPHTAAVDQAQVDLSEEDSTELTLRLKVPAATVGDAAAYRQVSGQVVLTPLNGGNHGVALRLNYYLVPRSRSNIDNWLDLTTESRTETDTIHNRGTAVPGSADFYAWGLSGDHQDYGDIGIRAVGVQTNRGGPRPLAVFAINTFERWSTPNPLAFGILVDTRSGTGASFHPNYLVQAADVGLLTGIGSFSGLYGVATVNLASGAGVIRFVNVAATDNSIVYLPTRLSDLGVDEAHPRFTYSAQSQNVRGEVPYRDATPGQAGYNAFHSAISQGQFVVVNPGATATQAVTLDSAEQAVTPALGLMIVSVDNPAGDEQAELVPIKKKA